MKNIYWKTLEFYFSRIFALANIMTKQTPKWYECKLRKKNRASFNYLDK